jgi:hypothetical protein
MCDSLLDARVTQLAQLVACRCGAAAATADDTSLLIAALSLPGDGGPDSAAVLVELVLAASCEETARQICNTDRAKVLGEELVLTVAQRPASRLRRATVLESCSQVIAAANRFDHRVLELPDIMSLLSDDCLECLVGAVVASVADAATTEMLERHGVSSVAEVVARRSPRSAGNWKRVLARCSPSEVAQLASTPGRVGELATWISDLVC